MARHYCRGDRNKRMVVEKLQILLATLKAYHFESFSIVLQEHHLGTSGDIPVSDREFLRGLLRAGYLTLVHTRRVGQARITFHEDL